MDFTILSSYIFTTFLHAPTLPNEQLRLAKTHYVLDQTWTDYNDGAKLKTERLCEGDLEIPVIKINSPGPIKMSSVSCKAILRPPLATTQAAKEISKLIRAAILYRETEKGGALVVVKSFQGMLSTAQASAPGAARDDAGYFGTEDLNLKSGDLLVRSRLSILLDDPGVDSSDYKLTLSFQDASQ